MKKAVKKIFMGIGIGIISIPILLIVGIFLFEIVGMIVNHAVADKHVKNLKTYIESSIDDVTISDVYSFTGNTTGTGNHVECESKVTFETALTKEEVESVISEKYEYHELEIEDGSYVVTVYGDVPFRDNIEGH